MLFRSLALAALLALGPLGVTAPPAAAQAEAAPMSTEELMHATGLDEVFTQFAATVEASPALQGTPIPASMQAAWSASARQAFAAGAMHDDLVATLDGHFTPEEIGAFAAFFSSPFGEMVTEIERMVTTLPPDGQFAARDEGLALAGEEDARRHEQIDEMLRLVSAEIATTMVRQSIRGLLIGMSITGQRGDIQVPWEEIDAQIDAIMPEIEADVATTQRAMMFYAYRDLSETELDRYLEFLRTDAARKLYALAAYAIGQIVTERMELFGETLARRLATVGV